MERRLNRSIVDLTVPRIVSFRPDRHGKVVRGIAHFGTSHSQTIRSNHTNRASKASPTMGVLKTELLRGPSPVIIRPVPTTSSRRRVENESTVHGKRLSSGTHT